MTEDQIYQKLINAGVDKVIAYSIAYKTSLKDEKEVKDSNDGT